MAKDSSFDVVSEPDLGELKNAIDQTRREIETRYDFQGHHATIDWDGVKYEIVLSAPEGMVMESLQTVLSQKMAKRNISLRFLEFSDPVAHGMNRAVVTVRIKKGIETPKAKEIQKAIKALGLKVDVQIQGDTLRVSSKSKDDLQKTIQSLRGMDFGIEIGFNNFR